MDTNTTPTEPPVFVAPEPAEPVAEPTQPQRRISDRTRTLIASAAVIGVAATAAIGIAIGAGTTNQSNTAQVGDPGTGTTRGGHGQDGGRMGPGDGTGRGDADGDVGHGLPPGTTNDGTTNDGTTNDGTTTTPGQGSSGTPTTPIQSPTGAIGPGLGTTGGS